MGLLWKLLVGNKLLLRFRSVGLYQLLSYYGVIMGATDILGGNKLLLKLIDISLFRLISLYKVAMCICMWWRESQPQPEASKVYLPSFHRDIPLE